MARQVLENGVILPAEYSDDWYDDMTSNLTKLDDVIGSDSEKLSSADVGAAALSNNYNDLDNLPTIPTVNNAALTIQKNGVDVQTFTANASSNVTANITVPTKTSDLTNDSNFVDTSNPAVSSGITSAKVTDYDTHIADTDIHVTTADKNRWNNQTYVFRYSSTALVASSTNSNTLLDNTDNLKVGDKVIDSSGVLFSITAIDTQNSTFTIGTALIDLAQDSDVVHKSGDETVGGVKTFANNKLIVGRNTDIVSVVQFVNSNVVGDSANGTSGFEVYGTSVSDANKIGGVTVGEYSNNGGSYAQIECNRTMSGVKSSNAIRSLIRTDGSKELSATIDNDCKLGNTFLRWSKIYGTEYYYGSNNVEFSTKFVTTDTDQTISGNKTFSSINGVEPSSLSLPSGNANDVIDISSYLTDLSGNVNNYTAPANGWISITMNNCSGMQAYITGFWGHQIVRPTVGGVRFLMPVLKNKTVNILIFNGTIDNARFIPCQGNV